MRKDFPSVYERAQSNLEKWLDIEKSPLKNLAKLGLQRSRSMAVILGAGKLFGINFDNGKSMDRQNEQTKYFSGQSRVMYFTIISNTTAMNSCK